MINFYLVIVRFFTAERPHSLVLLSAARKQPCDHTNKPMNSRRVFNHLVGVVETREIERPHSQLIGVRSSRGLNLSVVGTTGLSRRER